MQKQVLGSAPLQKGTLIQVLHKAQKIIGYLPHEVQQHIAFKLFVPSSKVYGVVSFYSFFKTKKEGEFGINVCMGTACFVKGAEAVLDAFKKELNIDIGDTTPDNFFTLGSIRCVGACSLAPVVMINDKVYGRVKADDVKSIIEEYMAKEDGSNG